MRRLWFHEFHFKKTKLRKTLIFFLEVIDKPRKLSLPNSAPNRKIKYFYLRNLRYPSLLDMCINSQGFIFIRYLIFATNPNRSTYPVQRKVAKFVQKQGRFQLKRYQ